MDHNRPSQIRFQDHKLHQTHLHRASSSSSLESDLKRSQRHRFGTFDDVLVTSLINMIWQINKSQHSNSFVIWFLDKGHNRRSKEQRLQTKSENENSEIDQTHVSKCCRSAYYVKQNVANWVINKIGLCNTFLLYLEQHFF